MKICRDDLTHPLWLPAPVADSPGHARHRLAAATEQPLELVQACPLVPAQQPVQLRARNTDLLGERDLCDLGRSQIAMDEARDLILDAGGASDRVGVVRAAPDASVGGTEYSQFIRDVVRWLVHRSHAGAAHLYRISALIEIFVRVPQLCVGTSHEGVVNRNLALINSYHPNLDPVLWASMRSFVCDTVRDRFTAGRTVADTRRALGALTVFADWALFSGSGELLLRDDIIDAYIAHRHLEVNAAVTERERKLLRTLGGYENTREDRENSTSASPSTPLTVDEQDEVRVWMSTQPSAERRRQCTAIAALGLGVGLTSHEMMNVRGRDVITLHDGMAGVVLDDRLVPVLADWDDELTSCVHGLDDYLISPRASVRTSNTLRDVIRGSRGPVAPVQRMRATWLLQHVNAGTPLNNLMVAAGLEDASFLRRLLPFAIELTGTAHVEALRLGGEVVR